VSRVNEHEVVELLNDPTASAEQLLTVVDDHLVDGQLRDGALNHPSIGPETTELLLIRADPDRRRRLLAAIENPDVLSAWANSHDPADRAIVAFNPYTPPGVVGRLGRDPDPRVRANTVFNPALPLAMVRAMRQADVDANVREAAETALTTSAGWALRSGQRWAVADDD
jgi:hypothetical protein